MTYVSNIDLPIRFSACCLPADGRYNTVTVVRLHFEHCGQITPVLFMEERIC